MLLLGLLCLLSFAARAAWLTTPDRPIFDESYYVNAARVIDGIRPPTGTPYATRSPGIDPNREHPPLAKVMIVLGIRVFGDGPVGWRATSMVFGTAAIAAMFALVRAAGASRWTAVVAAALLAVDNLFFVHGVVATLDVVALFFMLAGVALYLRDRPWLAGAVIGVGACSKMIAFSALAVVVALEGLRAALPARAADSTAGGTRRRRRLTAAGGCVAAAAVAYLGALLVLDRAYTTFPDPVTHTRHMLSYAQRIPDRHVHRPDLLPAETSRPLEWLANRQPIVYYQHISPPPGPPRSLVFVQGRMSPFVIYLALPALAVAAAGAWRRRDDVSFLVLAWFGGTFLTLALISTRHHSNYLFYMLVVLPGICLGVVRLLSAAWVPRAVAWVYAVGLAYGFVSLYPLRAWGAG